MAESPRKRTSRIGRSGSQPIVPKDPPSMIDREIAPMKNAENDKLQARSMPDTRDKHGDEGRKRHHAYKSFRSGKSFARDLLPHLLASRGNPYLNRVEQIGRDVTAQRNVPPLPEIDNILRLVGRAEVKRKVDRKHPRETERHIGVTGEIEIQLQRIAKCATPREHRR